MKLIEKIREGLDSVENGERRAVFSFEFYPPRTEDGLDSLIETMERFISHQPLFCDITWRSNGSSANLTPEIANRMQNTIGVETMMHLTCTNMSVEKIDRALETSKSIGVLNVLALRGDPPKQSNETPASFAYALDLVKHIRSKYGDYFCIAVAGYPEGHPDVMGSDGVATQEVYEEDLAHLKKKVDAGAALIITQLFYDTDVFLKFVDDCHKIGITCPIVPGILPISNYKSFKRMSTLCKTKIPPEIASTLESIKDNEAAVKSYGIQLGTEMCRKILAHGIKTLHFYTMNKEESTLAILGNLGLIEYAQMSSPLRWREAIEFFQI